MFANILTLGLAASALATPVRRAAPALKVTVSTPANVEHADNLYAVVEMTNTGSEAVEVNSFNTVFSPLETNDFQIDGTAAAGEASAPAFVGAVARYVADPTAVREAGGLIRLAAGESKSVKTTLATRYDFTRSGAGTYTIATPAEFSVIPADAANFETVTAAVEPATVDLRGTLVSKREENKLDKRIGYVSCSTSRQSLITAATSAAQSGSVKAASSLGATSSAYTTWFGAYTAARASTARSVYRNMNGRFARITYDCTCTMSGVYAYVYPNDPTKVYLCPVFWQVGTVGFDSKTDTLIHEVSHFNVVGSTDDITYGQENCRSLARSSPAQAVQNADNYAYFFDAVTA